MGNDEKAKQGPGSSGRNIHRANARKWIDVMIQALLWILAAGLFLYLLRLMFVALYIFGEIIAIVLENIEDFIKTKV